MVGLIRLIQRVGLLLCRVVRIRTSTRRRLRLCQLRLVRGRECWCREGGIRVVASDGPMFVVEGRLVFSVDADICHLSFFGWTFSWIVCTHAHF